MPTVDSEVARILALIAGTSNGGLYTYTTTALATQVKDALEKQNLIVLITFQPDIVGTSGASLYVHGFPVGQGS